MNRKLPVDAFGYYAELGPQRSYAAAAAHFGVSRRTVAAVGSRELWAERAADIDRRARERARRSTTRQALATRLRTERDLLREWRQREEQRLRILERYPIRNAAEAIDVLEAMMNVQLGILAGATGGIEALLDEMVRRAERGLPLVPHRRWPKIAVASGGSG